jgi:glucose-6-phosphate-specific signal transduction histidine kinase
MQESDTARALIFLALAVTTAVFLKIRPRLVKIGLLALSTATLIVITAASLPVDFGLLAFLLMIIASVVFLLSPAMLDSQIYHRQSRRPAYESGVDRDVDASTRP